MRSAAPVLVVDRDDAVRDAVIVSLEDAGYRVVAFASTRDFLASGPPGCLVLDLDLPEVDRVALSVALRGRQPMLPTVMTTPVLRRERRRVEGFPGIVAVLEQPFGNPELLGRVGDAMRQAA